MRPLDETQQYREEPALFVTLLLQPCGHTTSRKIAKSKSRKSLESRTWQILEPNTSPEKQFDEYWRDVIVTSVKEGQESRCEQKCKKSRDPILKFSLLTMHAKLTRSQQKEIP